MVAAAVDVDVFGAVAFVVVFVVVVADVIVGVVFVVDVLVCLDVETAGATAAAATGGFGGDGEARDGDGDTRDVGSSAARAAGGGAGAADAALDGLGTADAGAVDVGFAAVVVGADVGNEGADGASADGADGADGADDALDALDGAALFDESGRVDDDAALDAPQRTSLSLGFCLSASGETRKDDFDSLDLLSGDSDSVRKRCDDSSKSTTPLQPYGSGAETCSTISSPVDWNDESGAGTAKRASSRLTVATMPTWLLSTRTSCSAKFFAVFRSSTHFNEPLRWSRALPSALS